MKQASVLCLLSVAAMISGCHGTRDARGGGSGKPSVADPPPTAASSVPISDPCSLVTVDEVSEAMGRKSKSGELHKAFNGNRCNFYDATSQYEIFLQTVDWNVASEMMTAQNAEQGIGDKAYWSFGALYVFKNGRGMMIGFQLPDVLSKLTPPAKKLAQIASSRM